MSSSSEKTREVAVTASTSIEPIEIGVKHILRARGTDITVEEWSSIDSAYYTTGVILADTDAEFANSSSTGNVRLSGVGAGSLVITRIRLEDI